MESAIGLYKTELIARRGPWRDLAHVEMETAGYCHWFNFRRIHSAIGDITPAEREAAWYAAVNGEGLHEARRRRHAPPRFPERSCRAGVRAPRWYRPAPSGLNGAAHRAGARRPAAAVDPGDLWRATGPAKRAGPRGCPGQQRRPPARTRPGRWPALHPAPERRHTGTRQPPPDTSGHLFDYVNRQKNYKADKRSAAKLSLNQSRGAPPGWGQRCATAAAAPAIAGTAAATGPAAPAGITGSGLVLASSTVKNARTAPARAANRRSHPRTADAGRPSPAAIVRCPAPAAAACSADPITAPSSARRDRHHPGSSTCVAPHPGHRALRGASTTPGPSAIRTGRGRACPRPPSAPPPNGQPSSPPARCRPTTGFPLSAWRDPLKGEEFSGGRDAQEVRCGLQGGRGAAGAGDRQADRAGGPGARDQGGDAGQLGQR